MVVMEAVANARYLLMSCALSQKIPADTPIWKRLIMGYFITDEIFGVSVASPAWVFGTVFGVVLGNFLPVSVVSALSVGLYGMFIAVIIPPARKNKIVAVLIIISFVASYIFNKLALFSAISSCMKIIILTVVISLGAAILFPVKEEK